MIRTKLPTRGLVWVCLGVLIAGCSLRSQQPIISPSPGVTEASHPEIKPSSGHTREKSPRRDYRLPASYTELLRGLLDLHSTESIEETLSLAYGRLEEAVGEDEADSLVVNDPMFNNEMALALTRKGVFEQAEQYLEKAWQGLHQERFLTASKPFHRTLFYLEDRLYDSAAMNANQDHAIVSAFRDFVFLQRESERNFIDRAMRRTHRFPPQPSLFPGSFATIPIEIVNDWYYTVRQVDLLTWQRFSHLPEQCSRRQIRQMKQALAINLLIVGVLQGNQEVVHRALSRLEQGFLSAGRLGDQNVQSVLMFGYFVLGDPAGVKRYEDSALKPILAP